MKHEDLYVQFRLLALQHRERFVTSEGPGGLKSL